MAISSLLAQAVRFSYPTSAENAHSVDLSFVNGDIVNITWDTDSIDPKKFSLHLWEYVAYPPAYELVAYNVDTEAKQATFKVPCHTKGSSDWQLTMVEGTDVYVLYAHTARFKINDRNGTCVALPPHPEMCSSSSSHNA